MKSEKVLTPWHSELCEKKGQEQFKTLFKFVLFDLSIIVLNINHMQQSNLGSLQSV